MKKIFITIIILIVGTIKTSFSEDIVNLNYIEMDGWLSSTVGITNFNDLPTAAKEYIRTIEKLANVPVVLISTGQRSPLP